MSDKPVTVTCSFCGKSQGEVKKLIAGPRVHICEECIGLCNDILAEELIEYPAELRQVLLREIDNHESAATVLDNLRERLGEQMPTPIREAIDLHGQAWRRLKGAVAEMLPAVLRSVEKGKEPARSYDAAGVWPELRRLVSTTNALLLGVNTPPKNLTSEELHAVVVATRALVTVRDLLEGGQGGGAPPTSGGLN